MMNVREAGHDGTKLVNEIETAYKTFRSVMADAGGSGGRIALISIY
jgi:hypothetical protein